MTDFTMMQDPEFAVGFGQTSFDEILQLNKALEANTATTNIADLRQLGALQPQSLEDMLFTLMYGVKHFVLWNDVPKAGAKSTLEEYNTLNGYGTEGGWTLQMETPQESDFSATRNFSFMKFLREQWKISDVGGLVETVPNVEIQQKNAAVNRLLRKATTGMYFGDSAIIPEQIDGFYKTIKALGNVSNNVDARGGAVTQLHFDQVSEGITANFGTVDGAGVYVSPGGTTAINQVLRTNGATTTQRIIQPGANGGISLGGRITEIVTPFGTMVPKTDIFLPTMFESHDVPKVFDQATKTLVEGATSGLSPNIPTVTVAATATVTGSLFTSSTGVRPYGATYNYRVYAVNRFGKSIACAQVNAGAPVANGGGNTLTITPALSGASTATGFVILSEQVAGSGVFRWIGSVAANGVTPVTFVDYNDVIPGTTVIFIMDFASAGEMTSYVMKRLAPLYSQELAKIGMYRWGITNLYITPQYIAPLRYGMIRNVSVSSESKSPYLEV
jgi:hypothetical protein